MISNDDGWRRETPRDAARRRLEALALHFADGRAALETARALAQAGELERAHRSYRHARKLGPLDANVDVEHAEVLRRLGRIDDAKALLTESAERHRASGGVRGQAVAECALGELYRDTGDLAVGVEIAERWLRHPEVWDLATFLWVDCISLEGRSLERAVKGAIERGNASPAMFHALLQELEREGNRTMARAVLAIGDETLFPGWLDAIPEMRSLAERLLSGSRESVRAAP